MNPSQFCMKAINGSKRGGLSLAEVLVVIAIISLLLALILPAVQASREAARKIECGSHLRQLSLAASNYASAHRYFPPSGGMDEASVFVRVLPYVEQQQLFRRFSFNAPMSTQLALGFQRPPVFVCPSDGVSNSSKLPSNYAGNVGWYALRDPNNPTGPTFLTGVISFVTYPQIQPENVRDGLSNTAFFSEVLPCDGHDLARAVWSETPSLPLFGRPVSAIASECLSATTNFMWPRNSNWTLGGFGETLYDHVLVPNSRSCSWVFSSASAHRGGVNVTFCDGSTRFIHQTVSLDVWRAWGTKAGKEVTASQ